jgi:hypothetical protein
MSSTQAIDDTTVAAAERIAVQIVANEQRTALTGAQRAKSITQMLLAGVSPAKVAKKLSVGRDTGRRGSHCRRIVYRLRRPGVRTAQPDRSRGIDRVRR